MSGQGPGFDGAHGRVAELVRVLRDAERELQEITGGQLDAVVTGAGDGTYLLAAAQRGLRESEAELRRLVGVQRAIFDALPAHVALVDSRGVILEVNQAWLAFAAANSPSGTLPGVGLNYLETCARSRSDGAPEAAAAAEGLRAVLAGESSLFQLEYPCHSPTEDRWFRLLITPLEANAGGGAVVMHVNVTERRAAEEAVRESERRYRMLFEGNPQPMWVFDQETLRFLAVNDAAIAKYGYGREQFASMTLRDIRPEDDLDALDEHLAETSGRTVPRSIWRHRLADGTMIWVEVSSSPVHFAGRPAKLVMATDITDRLASERALQASEREQRRLAQELDAERQRLVGAQSVAQVGSWETDLETLQVSWSAETHRIFGTDPRSFTPTHAGFLERVHPEDRDFVEAAFVESLRTRATQTIEHRVVRPDGGVRHVEERWQSFADGDGRPLRARGTTQDITERRMAELAVAESRERFRRVFHGASTGIAIMDASGRFLETNAAYRRMLGYDESDLQARSFPSLTHPDDLARSMERVRDLLEGRCASFVLEQRSLAKGGGIVWSRLSVSAQRDAAGSVETLIAVAEDITQQRAAEDALRSSQAMLRMAGKVGKFGAWTVDMLSREVTWSDEVRAIHELPDAASPSLEEGLSFYAPEHRETIRGAFGQCATAGVPFDLESEIITATGKRVAVRAIGEAVRDAGGRIVRVQGAFQDISESKAAEAREIALSERLGTTLENISDAFFTVDREWRFRYLNRRAEEILKRPRNELLGRVIWNEFPEIRDTEFEASYRLALEQGGTVEFEAHYPPLEAWLGVRAYPTPDGLAVYFRDVTDRRRAREDLQVSEERFRLLARATNDAIWDWNLVTDALWWNEGYQTLFGYAPEETEPNINAWRRNIHPDDRERTLLEVGRAVDDGSERWTGEYRYRRKDGRWVFVLDRGYIIRDESGRPVRMIGGMTDLTERRLAEERLAEQAALLDAASEAIMVKDMDDRIHYWNQGAERTYGWTAEEALGRTSAELISDDSSQIEPALQALLAEGRWQGSLRHRTKDGRVRDIEASYTVLRDGEGRPKAILSLNVDVTERRNLEAMLLRAQRLESIGTLAGGIAHDLNNVLTPILMAIELLREGESSEDRMALLSTMDSSAQRGADMVRQVLAFARGMQGTKAPMDLRHVGRDVARIMRDTFPKNIDLELQFAKDLWPIEADATQMHQVLMNLSVNARDAMPGGGRLIVSITNVEIDETYASLDPGARSGPHVLIQVADSGLGIPPEHRSRLFEPFFTTKEPGSGTGLGLPTVHTIVRGHGGFIDVRSEVGKGTEFRVYLPAAAEATEAEQVAGERSELPRGSGECVLVVDDEAPVREIVGKTLDRYNYRVLHAANGAEAVAMFVRRREDIAIVLTDMSMPIMDGPATIVALRAIQPRLRIVGSSGLATRDQVAKAASSGVRHFIPKPYTAETLLQVLRQALDEPE